MAQCPMNGKLDITECDNPVLSHRVAQCSYSDRGFGPTLCRFNILHIYLFIFYRPGNRRDILHLEARRIYFEGVCG